MRSLEIVILALVIVGSGAAMFRVRIPRRAVLASGLIALVAFVAHVLLEGTRWQMVPAYLGLALAFLMLMRFSNGRPEKKKRRFAKAILSGLIRFVVLPVLVVVACFIPWAVPVFEIPDPSGPYGIGVTDFEVDFEDRAEIYTADEDDHREVMVRAWYPAEVAQGSTPMPYLTEAELGPVVEFVGVAAPVPWFFNHLPLVATHSHREADIAATEGPFPVLVFSHGYGSSFAQNTPLMEELASHGYVVFSIAHTYDGVTLFPDGRAPGVGEHFVRAEAYWQGEEGKRVIEEWERGTAEKDGAVRRAALERRIAQERAFRAEVLGSGSSWEVWIDDRLGFFAVLGELGSGARPSLFAGKLDLGRVGLFGMSFGGNTAAEVCHLRPECRASVNLDGNHYSGVDSTLLDGASPRPLMMVYASEWTLDSPTPANPGDFLAANDFYYGLPEARGLRDDIIRLRIAGTTHVALTDFSLMMRGIPGMSSGTSGDRVAEILNGYCLAFFDEYVKGEGGRSPLLDGPTPEFPEVSLQTFGHAFADRRPPDTEVPDLPEEPEAGPES